MNGLLPIGLRDSELYQTKHEGIWPALCAMLAGAKYENFQGRRESDKVRDTKTKHRMPLAWYDLKKSHILRSVFSHRCPTPPWDRYCITCSKHLEPLLGIGIDAPCAVAVIDPRNSQNDLAHNKEVSTEKWILDLFRPPENLTSVSICRPFL